MAPSLHRPSLSPFPPSYHPSVSTPQNSPSPHKVRLQRYLADAGVAARRVCEQMIEEGRVKVNGRTVRDLPVFIDPREDRVEVGSRIIQPLARHVYIMLNKPERVLVAAADEPGLERTKVTDLVKHALAPRLFPVGRLEWDAQGLVLLTTDGEFAQRLTHPRYAVPKVYRVQVKGEVVPERVPELQAAVRRHTKLAIKRDAAMRRKAAKEAAGGGPLSIGAGGGGVGRRKELFIAPAVRLLDKDKPEWNEQRESQGVTLEITQVEARGVPLRDVLFAVGLPVRRLTRVGVGGLRLANLKVGDWRELSMEEVRDLLATPAWNGEPSPTPQEAQEPRTAARPTANFDRPPGDSRAPRTQPIRGMSERAFKDRERRKALRQMDRSTRSEPDRGDAQPTRSRPQPAKFSPKSSLKPSFKSGPNFSPKPARPACPQRPTRPQAPERPAGSGPRKGPRTILPE